MDANANQAAQQAAAPDFEFLWDEVEAMFLAHFEEPDLKAVRVVLSAVVAHYIVDKGPVWVMLIAPPGSMKTELLNALPRELLNAHAIDRVTTNTLVSGQVRGKNSKPRGLLHRVAGPANGNKAIIMCADFSTVLEMRSDARAEIFSQWRRIHDGRLRNEFGHERSDPPWEGRITFLVATTGIVDIYYSMFQALGERFVMVRWQRPPGEDAALTAMQQNIREVRQDLREAVENLLRAVLTPREVPQVPPELEQRLAPLVEFVVRARSHVMRDGRSKNIVYTPDAEAPTRLGQQLFQLVRGSALLAGRRVANVEDYRVALRAGLDSISAVKRKVLNELIADAEEGWQGRAEDNPTGSTRWYALEDLRELGLVSGTDLSPFAKDLVRRFKP